MQTATIPKTITKGEDLVVMPRKEYEELLSTIKFQKELDVELDESLKEMREGKTLGPFNTVDDLKKSLES